MEVIIASAISGALCTLITMLFNRKKNKSETNVADEDSRLKHVEADSMIIKNLQEEMQRLSAKVEEQDEKIKTQGAHIDILQEGLDECIKERDVFKKELEDLKKKVNDNGNIPLSNPGGYK